MLSVSLDDAVPLPDYLWGIETPNTRSSSAWKWGFQTTYEELKLLSKRVADSFSSFSLPDYLWGIETTKWYIWESSSTCFQTTYEELKLTHRRAMIWAVGRFQTTYEELKQHIDLKSWISYHASRLPMRNWNQEEKTERRCDVRLPDYLWGIETALRNAEEFVYLRFQTTYEELKLGDHVSRLEITYRASRLPMRNWNYWRCRQSRSILPSFQTTYEELKLGRAWKWPNSFSESLPDYLWGIETFPCM